MKGVCGNIIDISCEEKTLIVNKNEKNMNMSLMRENIKVLSAALMVYILEE
jgi:hypothetical protein